MSKNTGRRIDFDDDIAIEFAQFLIKVINIKSKNRYGKEYKVDFNITTKGLSGFASPVNGDYVEDTITYKGLEVSGWRYLNCTHHSITVRRDYLLRHKTKVFKDYKNVMKTEWYQKHLSKYNHFDKYIQSGEPTSYLGIYFFMMHEYAHVMHYFENKSCAHHTGRKWQRDVHGHSWRKIYNTLLQTMDFDKLFEAFLKRV